MFARTNIGSANTRKAKKALGDLASSVTVESSGYGDGGGSVSVAYGELETLMTARERLQRAGFTIVSAINSYRGMGKSVFYFSRQEGGAQ